MKNHNTLAAAIAAALFFVLVPAVLHAQEEPEEDKFVPLSELRPLERTEGNRNLHSNQYG